MTDPHKPPYHLVNQTTCKHIGPFSTYIDVLLASQIAAYGDRWQAMDKDEFKAHLHELAEGHH